jgi:hypothetical protein
MPQVVGSWFGLAIILLVMPVFFIPVFLLSWMIWDWASPTAIYSFLYDSGHMTIVGLAMLLFLVWQEGFKASLDEAPFLAKFQSDTVRPGWLWRQYLRRNRELIQAYQLVDDFETAEDSVEEYLLKHRPELFRQHTQMLSFLPEWSALHHISSHHRKGHVRNTRNGPVNVKPHYVRGHSRSRKT